MTNTHQQLAKLTQGFSIEVTPNSAKKVSEFRDFLRPGTEIYVTLIQGSTLDQTIDTCELLAEEGFVPVPHFAARQIPDRITLEDNLRRFVNNCGGTQVLAIAGGADKPLGEFDSSIKVLETGLFDKYGIKKIGVAGHPEGNSATSDAETEKALLWKYEFQQRTDADLYLVTQFCFESKPVIDWLAKLSSDGITLPVHIGIPGVATLKTLIRHATACGIGPSAKVIIKRGRKVSRLLLNTTPEQLMIDLASRQNDGTAAQIEKLHVYPFGGILKSAQWFAPIAAGQFAVNGSKVVLDTSN